MKSIFLKPEIRTAHHIYLSAYTASGLQGLPLCGTISACNSEVGNIPLTFGYCAEGVSEASSLNGHLFNATCSATDDLSAEMTDCQASADVQVFCNDLGDDLLGVECTVIMPCPESHDCNPTAIFVTTPDDRVVGCELFVD